MILMSKVNFPSIEEILGSEMFKPTKRGVSFFKKLARAEGVNESVFLRELSLAAADASHKSKISKQNLILAGYKKNRFVFVPYGDLA